MGHADSVANRLVLDLDFVIGCVHGAWRTCRVGEAGCHAYRARDARREVRAVEVGRPLLVGGSERRKNPGSLRVPETVNAMPVVATSNGMFVSADLPKLSSVAQGDFAAARSFVESSVTLNTAVSPHR